MLVRRARGHVLLMTMIAMAVLMLVVVGAIEFTGKNRQGAASQLSAAAVSSCAETAREYLLGRLRLFNGVPPASLVLDQPIPDSAAPAGESEARTAHYGDAAATATVVQVDSRIIGAQTRNQARDLSNTSPTSPFLGGQYFRVVVDCRQPVSAGSGTYREAELEFMFRYGI